MNARPEDIARINAWLGVERNAEDILAQLRNMFEEATAGERPEYIAHALTDFDALAAELTDVLGVTR